MFGGFGGCDQWPPCNGGPIGDFGSPGAPPPLGAVNNPMRNHNRNAQ
jgi:hypothetical protein